LPPTSRNNVVEWIGHALEEKEGLIALRYFFIELALNGENLGVYAIEEHFNKELLENRRSREGIIFSAKPNQIKIFNEKKISKDLNKKNQIRFLQSALQSVKNNELEIERIFDLEKFASHFAIIDLMDGYHAVGDNSIYYLNPVTNLIEPITREYNSLRYSDGQPNVEKLMIDLYQGEGESWAFANKLFKNNEFTEKYLIKLSRLSNKQYLDEFFEEIDEDLSQQINIIYREDPFYKFPKEYLYERQGQIKAWLNKDLMIVANVNEDNDSLLSVRVKNDSPFPIELIKIFSTNQSFELFLDNIVLPRSEISLSIESEQNININELNYSYQIHGIQNLPRDSIVVPKSFIRELTLSKLWNTSNEYLFNNSDIKVDYSNNIIFFDNKVHDIEKDIFIPENFIVKGKPGLILNLLNGASIYSKSAFNFNGSIIDPIKFTSSDRKGGGLVIISPKTESIFINTIFEHLTSPNLGSSGLTASITIYDTDASFHDCILAMNESEDFLNLINSKYELSNLDFKSVKSDAFDSDYSNGIIINSIFTDIGNDAMDFSGSISELSEIRIDGVGDKVLSAGEKSKISGKHIDILNAEIGITSKDLSEVDLINVKIKDTRLGFAVFQKKAEYGPSKAKVAELEMTNVDFVHLVDLNSTLNLNGKDVINKRPKVENFLYGANFGKSSN
ncbi:CotH kinase family protein, partial [Candidatus Thioglobus sp.]|nr:CotH kinase family protein [Candidatus Thioglobus sp.]